MGIDTSQLFTAADVSNIYQVSVNVVRKTMKKLNIVGMQCLVKNSMRYFYTKDDYHC